MNCQECGDVLVIIDSGIQSHFYCVSCKELTAYTEGVDETEEYRLFDRIEDVPKEFWENYGEWDE